MLNVLPLELLPKPLATQVLVTSESHILPLTEAKGGQVLHLLSHKSGLTARGKGAASPSRRPTGLVNTTDGVQSVCSCFPQVWPRLREAAGGLIPQRQ